MRVSWTTVWPIIVTILLVASPIWSPAAVAQDQAAAEQPPGGTPQGLLGPVRVGPAVSVTVPHPLSFGLDVTYEDLLSFGFTTSSFDQDFGDVALGLSHSDVRARWHVFQGSFFLGAAYGSQSLTAEASDTVSATSGTTTITADTQVKIEIETPYFTPHLGWLWIWDSGFTMGFEFGVQVPTGDETTLEIDIDNVSAAQEALIKNTQEYKNLEDDVTQLGETVGQTSLPYVSLLKLGWVF